MDKIELIKKASKAYYEGSPIMSDEEFDILVDETGFDSVGYSVDGLKQKHAWPLYSLQKVFSGETTPPDYGKEEVIVTPKLDGSAISILYRDGKLLTALTRGDGKEGLVITDKVKLLVPNTSSYNELHQVTGEVVAHKSIKNARNYCAGALNLKDLNEFKTRELRFIAYDRLQPAYDSYDKNLATLQDDGFDTVLDSDWSEYPQDGTVFRLNSYNAFDNLGFTSHHPRGAYALKTRKEGQVTRLIDVVWQVGKSGVVSPVGIVEPVDIDGATVSKATLHNMAYITELNLEIGCDVEIIRSGDIIPRIVRRV